MATNGSAYGLIEAVQYQATLVQHARRAGLNVREAVARGDKVTRAQPAAAKWAHGDVYIPRNASWSEAWLQEHLMFNRGTHDDMVDTTAYAAIEVQKLALTASGMFAPAGITRVSPWMR
jgi:predicted phage terminase large subunit-like protein